jgi:hypothetical protein
VGLVFGDDTVHLRESEMYFSFLFLIQMKNETHRKDLRLALVHFMNVFRLRNRSCSLGRVMPNSGLQLSGLRIPARYCPRASTIRTSTLHDFTVFARSCLRLKGGVVMRKKQSIHTYQLCKAD